MNVAAWLLAVGFTLSALGMATRVSAAESMTKEQIITKADSRSAMQGSEKFFTGHVRIDPLFMPKHPDAPFSGAYVTFEPGARTHWHIHPVGQHLVVTSGVGLTGTADGKVYAFKSGDVIWCPKGVKHWHGASPAQAMTHLAITGTTPDGKNVQWMEPVTDEQYFKK